MYERTYIADLTTEELVSLIRKTVREAMKDYPRYVKGIQGLMDIFDCSESTAQRIKSSGMINKAIRQQGRTFIVNADLALELFGQQPKRKYHVKQQ